MLFQLHHTGIKINLGLIYTIKSIEFQLHHTGIKIANTTRSGIVTAISIAPYRN